MKVITITALASLLSVTMAREAYFEHRRALDSIVKRNVPGITMERRASSNLATFTGALGGITATAITCSGNADRQFEVNGDTFVNFAAAAQRSCDEQQNACSDAANAGGQSFTVADCQTQQAQCNTEQTASAGTCTGAAASTGSASNTTAASGSASTCASAKHRREVHF